MSGFSGGGAITGTVSDLIRQVQSEQNATSGQTPATQPTAQPQGIGPGNANAGAYNTQGTYNTLATDMSRGNMGSFGFGGNQFSYTPFGNPFTQQMPFGFGGQQQPPQMPNWSPQQRFAGSIAGRMGYPNPTMGQGYSNVYGGYGGGYSGYGGYNPYARRMGGPFGAIW